MYVSWPTGNRNSLDIGQNVSNFAGLVWKANFVHFFGNILGLGGYFLKLIFALKPWVQAGRFEYHEPHNLGLYKFDNSDLCVSAAW